MKQTLGALIARTRKEKGMTQLELAEKMGVTDKAVSKWERDLSCPDVSSLPTLAQVLGLSLEELMQNNGSRKETAEKLFLHRNTMAYRVKKIEEILGCSLGDPRTVQELAFLCKMREYQNT